MKNARRTRARTERRRVPPPPTVVELPPLEGLSVTVPAQEPITEKELLDHLFELARPYAEERELAPGERLALGHEAVVDVIGYANGQVIPGLVHEGLVMTLSQGELPPELIAGLVGLTVGSRREVAFRFPEDFEEPALRGAGASFQVHVKAGFAVRMPDLDSPELLARLGRGQTLEETLASLSRELTEALRDEREEEAEQLLLEQLLARSRVDIPEAELDAMLANEWEHGDGRVLSGRGMPRPQREQARAAWMADPERRADLLRSLRMARVLTAVVEREGLSLTRERWEDALAHFAEGLDMPVKALKAALKKEPARRKPFEQAALFQLALDHVKARATVRYEGD